MKTAENAALRRMKRNASGLLLVAVVVYVFARLREGDSHAWGYVRATAEAAMVGGIADWFAVTALFRHPLRLPIPHTAIIPKRKDAIGASLGTFVRDNFMSAEVVDMRIRGAAPAERIGRWLNDPTSARRVGDELGKALTGVAGVLDDEEVQATIDAVIVDRVRRLDTASGLATAIETTVNGRHHDLLVDALASMAGDYLANNQPTLRALVGDESPWWVPDVIDDRVFNRLHRAASNVVSAIRSDRRHPARRALDRQLATLIARLRSDEALRASIASQVGALVEHPDVRAVSAKLGQDLKQLVLREANDPTSPARTRVEAALVEFAERLLTEPQLRATVDDWLARAAVHIVDQLRPEVVALISSTVERWDGEETSQRLEEQVGRDLQFIRINGTIVGGLAGLAIHAIGEVLA